MLYTSCFGILMLLHKFIDEIDRDVSINIFLYYIPINEIQNGWK
jgi:hypothetical protein